MAIKFEDKPAPKAAEKPAAKASPAADAAAPKTHPDKAKPAKKARKP